MVSSKASESESLNKSLKDLNLSNDEVKKFEKAFQDPEFIKLFAEYAQEVSDPKAKAENDAYLRQLEAEGRIEEVYGKGMSVIVPNESFVLKTMNKSNSQKVFINVCSSDKVGKMQLQKKVAPSGKEGTHMEMPCVLGPAKTGKDKRGEPASIWDFVVHPESITSALGNRAIMGALAESAMEKIEGSSKGVVLHRGFKMPGMKYKKTEGAESPSPLRIGGQQPGEQPTGPKASAQGAGWPHATSSAAAPATSPQAVNGSSSGNTNDAASSVGASSQSAATASKFRFEQRSRAKAAALKPHEPGFKHPEGEVTPEWELCHRDMVDLAGAWGDAGRNLAATASTPQALVVRVKLPGIKSAGEVDLDVTHNKLSLSVPKRFLLEANLPSSVDDSRGKAKFETSSSTLTVTLPLLAPPVVPVPPLAAAKKVEELESTYTEEDETNGESDALLRNEEPPVVKDDLQTPVTVHTSTPSPQQTSIPASVELDLDQSIAGQPDVTAPTGPVESAPALLHSEHSALQNSSTSLAELTGEISVSSVAAASGMTENQRKWDEIHGTQAPESLDQDQAADDSDLETEGNQREANLSSGFTTSSSGSINTGAGTKPPPQVVTKVILPTRLCTDSLTDALD